MVKLVEVDVRGMLGRFDHRVEFPADQEFVILYGPNGIGKTKLLELIFSTFKAKFIEVDSIPFRSAEFNFSDGARLTLARLGQQSLLDDGESLDLQVSLETADGGKTHWKKSDGERPTGSVGRMLRTVEMRAPVSRISVDEWHDLEQDDILSGNEVIERYASLFPEHPFRLPEKITDFLGGVGVHLIETQRLLREGAVRGRLGRPARQTRNTVEVFSEHYAELLAETLAQNSRISQERDRMFPRKLLDAGTAPKQATESSIRARYAEQNRLRARLADISILDQTSTDLPLPRRELTDWERLVLWTYLDDSDVKLKGFQDLLTRVELFRDIVNSRFQFKQLHLGRDGFQLTGDLGNSLPVTSLSSGEQHELVLAYDLLFNVKSGSLVLIDEPEISLHVAWQQEFMNDIARIASAASLRFMVATHSPQIIHKWWSRAQSLAPGMGGAE
jgi:ABC-type Mn2+/Zn2+ transport system ATPase subunit